MAEPAPATTKPRTHRAEAVEVLAMQWDGSEESQRAIVNWTEGDAAGFFGRPPGGPDGVYYLRVRHDRGEDCALKGDWLVRDPEWRNFRVVPEHRFPRDYRRIGP